jgi:hypothetical protein
MPHWLKRLGLLGLFFAAVIHPSAILPPIPESTL